MAGRRQEPGRAPSLAAVLALVLGVSSLLAPRSLDAREGSELLPADPLAGRQVFIAKGCDRCHGIWGKGEALGPDLGRGGVWHSVMQLAGALWNHSPEMIEKMRERRMPRPTISTPEMADLAAFLYFLNYFDPPGDPAEGKRLFTANKCRRCHALGGRGGSAGPALDHYERFASPLFLARAMWSHTSSMGRRMAEESIPRPEFAGADLAHIFAYVQNASIERSRDKVYMVPGSPVRGEEIFESKGCVQCHTARAAGGHVGPALGERKLHRSVTEIAGLMWNHAPAMGLKMREIGISSPSLSDQEMSDLLAYLFFLQYFDPPGDPVQGQGLFMDKGCVLCHYAPRGTETLLAPDLSRSAALSSPLELSSAMWNHAPAMEAQIRERGLVWPRFQGNEVRDLVAYLRSLRKPETGH